MLLTCSSAFELHIAWGKNTLSNEPNPYKLVAIVVHVTHQS